MTLGDDFLKTSSFRIFAEEILAMKVRRPESFVGFPKHTSAVDVNSPILECQDCGGSERGNKYTYYDDKGLARLVCRDCFDSFRDESEQWYEDITETDPDVDATAATFSSIRKAILDARSKRYEPALIAIHPYDFEEILLSPNGPVRVDSSLTPSANGSIGTIYGIPIVEDASVKPGQAVVVNRK